MTVVNSRVPKGVLLTETYIQVNTRLGELLVPLVQISHFSFADKYATMHINDAPDRLVELSLATIEAAYPQQFVRVHRAYLVNRDALLSLEPIRKKGSTTGVLTLVGAAHKVPVGRRRMNEVGAALASCSHATA